MCRIGVEIFTARCRVANEIFTISPHCSPSSFVTDPTTRLPTPTLMWKPFLRVVFVQIHRERPQAYEDTERISLVCSFLASVLAGRYAEIETSDGSGMNLMHIRCGVTARVLVALLKIEPRDVWLAVAVEVPDCVPTCLATCVPDCVPTGVCLPACLLACVRACVCLHARVRTRDRCGCCCC